MNVSSPVLYSYLLRGLGLLVALYLIFTLEPHWVSCLFTLGGIALLLSGVRSRKFAVRIFGLLLQCIGLYLFLDAVWYPFRAPLLLNSYFLGSCFIVLSAFISAYYLETSSTGHFKRDRWTILFLLFLGTLMWYAGGLREIYMKIVIQEQLNGVLLFIAATSIIVGIIGDKSHWQRLHYLLLLQLPMTLCILIFQLISVPADYQLLIGWGTTVWPVTFFIQYRILAVLDGGEWLKLRASYHFISLWMVLFVSCREFILSALQVTSIGFFSICLVTIIIGIVWIFVVRCMARKRYWPVALYPNIYLWGGVVAVVFFMLGWFMKFVPL